MESRLIGAISQYRRSWRNYWLPPHFCILGIEQKSTMVRKMLPLSGLTAAPGIRRALPRASFIRSIRRGPRFATGGPSIAPDSQIDFDVISEKLRQALPHNLAHRSPFSH